MRRSTVSILDFNVGGGMFFFLFPLFLSSSSLLLCFSVVCACGRCLCRDGSCDEVCRIDWTLSTTDEVLQLTG